MRSDRNLPQDFRDENQWTVDPQTGAQRPEYERLRTYGTEFHRHSYSGRERNKLFLNHRGQRFFDLAGISGADEVADSRSWVKWDFDRDGWQDIALVNANKPLLGIFRNQLGNAIQNNSGNFVAVRFVGGNHQATPSNQLTTRDGYGAVVVIETEAMKLTREHRCGEGYAAQNSTTILIGIGKESAAKLTVTWPSGLTRGPIDVHAGQLVECFESSSPSVNGSHFDVQPYRPTTPSSRRKPPHRDSTHF